jgi:DNA repair protein RadC
MQLIDSPWNRIQQNGLRTSSATDLLAVGLSRRPEDVGHMEETAKSILKILGSIRAFGDLSADHLKQEAGLSGEEAFRAMALIELGRRIGLAGKGEKFEVYDARSIYDLLSHLRDEKKEYFVLVMLDAQNGVIRVSNVHIGTLTSSMVGPREVFRDALREGASSIVVAHNHPSGEPTPSPEDIDVTERLMEVGKMLDIPLVDHVIIGEGKFVSLRERGVIK